MLTPHWRVDENGDLMSPTGKKVLGITPAQAAQIALLSAEHVAAIAGTSAEHIAGIFARDIAFYSPLLESGAVAIGTVTAEANLTVTSTATAMLRWKIGNLVRIAGRCDVELTGSGAKFFALGGFIGLGPQSVMGSAAMRLADGSTFLAEFGYLDSNRLFINPGTLGGAASGAAGVRFDVMFTL